MTLSLLLFPSPNKSLCVADFYRRLPMFYSCFLHNFIFCVSGDRSCEIERAPSSFVLYRTGHGREYLFGRRSFSSRSWSIFLHTRQVSGRSCVVSKPSVFYAKIANGFF